MAVRFRKYLPQCKPINCGGRKSKHCPDDRPRRANGDHKTCGVWCVEFIDDTKEWQSLTFKDVRCKADAEKRLAMFISDRERGVLNLPRKRDIPTLAEYNKRYLELYATAKENTRKKKAATIKPLVKLLGDYRLDKITPFIVEKYRIDRTEKGRVSSGTINDEITTLTHLFNKAIKEEIVDKNPCRDIKRLKVAQKRDRILTVEETSLLFGKLDGKERLMVIVGLFTGMRLNEVLKLKWADIDFQKQLITFTQSKTGKLISMPLSTHMVQELMVYKSIYSSEFLFENRRITSVVVSHYSACFSSLFKELGILDFTFHNLRYTFASLQGDLGTGAIVTKELLGHSSLNQMLVYSHTGLESKRRAVEVLTNHVLKGCKESVSPLAIHA